MTKPKKRDLKEAITRTIADIEKQHGSGAAMLLSKRTKIEPCDVIPSGCLAMDIAIGPGGYPRGRIIEMYGPNGSGKSTLAQQLVAQCQRGGELAAYIDVENAISLDYAEKLGVDRDMLIFSQPDSGEQALDIAERLIRSGVVGVVVVDSVAGLVPKAELEGEFGDSFMGLQARLMGQGLRKLTTVVRETNTVLLFINQIREKIGITFGSNETQPGGRALGFWASVRIDVRTLMKIKEGDRVIGSRLKVKCVKNKVGPPFVEAECDLIFGKGILHAGEVLEQGQKQGVIERRGAYYYEVNSPNGDILGASKAGAIATIEGNKELDARLCADIMKRVRDGAKAVEEKFESSKED